MRLLYRRIISGGMVFLLLIVGLLFTSNRWIQVSHHIVPLTNLPSALDGFQLVHMTDFHSRSPHSYPLPFSRVAGPADLYLLTGDFVEGNPQDLQGLESQLRDLVAEAPVLAVLGNHDWQAGEMLVRRQLEEWGVLVLENEVVHLTIRGQPLSIAGIGDQFSGRDEVQHTLAQWDHKTWGLFLSHDPRIYDQLPTTLHGLVLTGHTHGGQIRLPGLPTLYAPGQGFSPRFGEGFYGSTTLPMHVSRGLGATAILPFRFWNRPRIDRIQLVSS